jgi:hypothetical protein
MVGYHSSVVGDPNEVDTVLQMVTNMHRLIHNNTRYCNNPSHVIERVATQWQNNQRLQTITYLLFFPFSFFFPIIYSFALAFSSSIDWPLASIANFPNKSNPSLLLDADADDAWPRAARADIPWAMIATGKKKLQDQIPDLFVETPAEMCV